MTTAETLQGQPTAAPRAMAGQRLDGVLVDGGWLLAILPPGAFFSLALAVAAKNALDLKKKMTKRA